jgi:hypothetical protein
MWKRWLGIILAVFAAFSAFAYWYTMSLPGIPHRGPLPAVTSEEVQLAQSLRRHVTAIASAPHNVRYHAELEAAAAYIEKELRASGHTIKRQSFEADGKPFRNIECVLEPRGGAPAARDTIVVGAHYDSFGDAPGANDNGSGTAMLLELARLLSTIETRTTRIRLAFFVNEELPYWGTPAMGSRRYAQALKESNEPVRAMLSLETLGYFSDQPGSQAYPQPIGLFMPNTANFITFTGTLEARALVHEAVASFRRHTQFPTIGGVAPGFIKGIDWSDHKSFSEVGIPAIMVTDTALFRYPHYHKPTDTADKLDYERLARITKGIERVVRELVR